MPLYQVVGCPRHGNRSLWQGAILQPVDRVLQQGREQSDMVAIHETVVHIDGHIYP